MGTLALGNDLLLNTGLGDAFTFDFQNVSSVVSNDRLNVAGLLNINNTNTIDLNISRLNKAQIPGGTGTNYTLFNYGTVDYGAGSLTDVLKLKGVANGHQTFSLLNNAATHEIWLHVTGDPVAARIWVGDGSANAWDFATANWKDSVSGNPVAFVDTDELIFDGTGSNAPDINVTATVLPSDMLFSNNSSHNYKFIGTGKIGGVGGMEINNGGTVILANTGGNDFSGNIIVKNASTLQIGDGTTTQRSWHWCGIYRRQQLAGVQSIGGFRHCLDKRDKRSRALVSKAQASRPLAHLARITAGTLISKPAL